MKKLAEPTSPHQSWWQRPWAAPTASGLLALGVRLLALPALARPEYYFAKYPTLALEMMRGAGQALVAFSASPLYLYFWVLMHRLFPGFPGAVTLVQMALGSVTCAVIAVAARAWVGPAGAWAAGLLAAVYLPFVVNDASYVSEGLVLLCNSLALVGLGQAMRRPRLGWAALAGAAIGLSGAARPNILLVVPFAAAALWWGTTASLAQRLRLLVGFGLLAAAGPLAITGRNLVVSGQPVLVMSDSGIVLYLGNHELDTGLSYYWPRHEPLFATRPGEVDPTHRVAHEIAERESERRLGPGESARFWRNQALEFVRRHPLEYAVLVVRKLAHFWGALEPHDVQTTFAQEYRLRRWPLVRFAWLGPLGLTGLVLTWRSWRRLWPLYGLIATYTATGLLFTVVARYRLPMLPAVLILAVLAVQAGVSDWRRRRWAGLAWPLGVLVLSALVVNRPSLHSRAFVCSQVAQIEVMNLVEALVEAGLLDQAKERLEPMLRQPPSFAVLLQARHERLAIALREGDQAAAATWREAYLGPRLPTPELGGIPDSDRLEARVRRDRGDAEAWLYLGVRRWEEGKFAAAERCFRRLTGCLPTFATGHLNRAWCLLRLGRLPAARRWAEAARRLQPELPDVHRLVLDLAAAEGRRDAVRADYERLAALYPEIPAYAEALGELRRPPAGEAAPAPAAVSPPGVGLPEGQP